MKTQEEMRAYWRARSGRKREVRAATLNLARQTQTERVHLRLITPDAERPYWRPETRADCDDVPRPCPYVGCQWNLYLDVNDETGNLKLNFPDIAPEDMPANRSCALDLAERNGLTLEEAGEALNVTRERIRQIELIALRKLLAVARRKRLSLESFVTAKGPK